MSDNIQPNFVYRHGEKIYLNQSRDHSRDRDRDHSRRAHPHNLDRGIKV